MGSQVNPKNTKQTQQTRHCGNWNSRHFCHYLKCLDNCTVAVDGDRAAAKRLCSLL